MSKAFYVFSLLLSLATGSGAFAQMACLSVHADRTARISSHWQEIKDEDQFPQLLLMLGSGKMPKITEKDLKERGEISLGSPLSDGTTLALEYKIDPRFYDPVFRLSKIEIVNRVGQKEVLSKDPIDAKTGELQPLTIQDLSLARGETELSFPLTIEGPLFQRLMESSLWLEHVTPQELRSLENRTLRSLRWQGNLRRYKAFIRKELGKQVFRGLLFGGLSFGGTWGAMHLTRSDVMDSFAKLSALPGNKKVGDIADLVAKSDVITANDKLQLLAKMARFQEQKEMKPQTYFDGQDLLLRAEPRSEALWILQKSSGRIFLTALDIRSHQTKVEIKIGALVEIHKESAPESFGNALKLFQMDH